MGYGFCKATIFVLLSVVGLGHGAGVITVDVLRGSPGGSVTFPTSLKPAAEPFLVLTWSFNTTISIVTSTTVQVVGHGYENRISLDKTTGSLTLRDLRVEDSGEYELIIIPHGAEQILGAAKLEVAASVPRPVMICPTHNLIEGHTSVNLTCDADGTASREWTHNGRPVVAGGRFSFFDGNRVLSISPVNRTDTGEVACNVSSHISSDAARCSLKVYYGPDRPVITQLPIGAELEDSVTLMCAADSLPRAKFTWSFRNMMIRGPVHYIHEMQTWHLGRYTCTASNPLTGQEASVSHWLTDSASPVSMSVMVCTVLTSVGLMLT